MTGAQDGPPVRGRQARPTGGPWFGEPLPPPFGKEPAVIVGTRTPRPFTLPAGDAASPEFAGAAIRKDLEAIVAISQESRATREIGDGGLWGRVSGYPSGTKAINYAVEQFKKAGIADVRVQAISQEPNARLWMPLSWEVKLLGRSCARRRKRRCRAGVGRAAGAFRDSGRHDHGAVGVCRHGKSCGPSAHRRQRQSRRAARHSSGAHALRARRCGFAVSGARQAWRCRCAQSRSSPWERAIVGLPKLRKPVLQPRRT